MNANKNPKDDERNQKAEKELETILNGYFFYNVQPQTTQVIDEDALKNSDCIGKRIDE